MKRYEHDADCFYPDSFEWKSLAHTNIFEEIFAGTHKYISSFGSGTFDLTFYITKVLVLVLCCQIKVFEDFW